MFGFSKTTIFISAIAIITLTGSGIFYLQKQNQPPSYETASVQTKDIEQNISVTGKIVAAEEIDLAFEKSGRISGINVTVGDLVDKDSVLVSLSATDELASVAEARANVVAAEAGLSRYRAAVSAAQADLSELESGSRPEEIQLARSKVTKSQQALIDAEQNLVNVQASAELDLANLYNGATNLIGAAYNHAEDAVFQQADQLFNEPYGRPILNFTTGDTRAQNSAETNMQLSQNSVDSLRTLATKSYTSQAQIDSALSETLNHLTTINNLLFDLTATLSSSNTLASATAAEYAADIAAARISINTDITNLTTRQQSIASQKITNNKNIDAANTSINTARDNLEIAQDELNIVLAGPTQQQIDSARAALNQAEANLAIQQAEVSRAYATLQRQNAELSKNNLIAPFKGIITDIAVTMGEIIGANQIAISMISDAQFEIEANIPEADIANVKVGNAARFTLDAFTDSDIFNASVATIDPAETITDGIATYEVKLIFDDENTLAKPGMTADIEIITDKKEKVLTIPYRAVERTGRNTTVTVLLPDGTTENRSVQLGLRDREGNVEVMQGLSENESVILGIISK